MSSQAPLFDYAPIPILILIARPAAGKSEIVTFLQSLSDKGRLADYQLGKLRCIDDFPMLWTWFEEDQILEEMGKPRLHTTADGYFIGTHLWDLLIRRIGLEYSKLKRDLGENIHDTTVLLEFARGTQHGGFRRAFEHLPDEILAQGAVIYIDVSFEESVRKNRRRFNPERPDSILEHGLPLDKMETLYRASDWEDLVKEARQADQSRRNGISAGYLQIRQHSVPYAVFDNEDDVTTRGAERLAKRLKQVIGSLVIMIENKLK